jgi:hypothetical protein
MPAAWAAAILPSVAVRSPSTFCFFSSSAVARACRFGFLGITPPFPSPEMDGRGARFLACEETADSVRCLAEDGADAAIEETGSL